MTWGWDVSTINPTIFREGSGFLGQCHVKTRQEIAGLIFRDYEKHWFPLIRPNIRALFHLISWGKRGLGESPLDCHDKTARCPGVKRLSTFNELPSLKLTAILHLKMDGMGRRLFPFLLGQQAYFRVRSVSFSDLHGNSTPANLLKGAGCSGIFGTMNQRFTKLRVNPPGCHVKTPQEL